VQIITELVGVVAYLSTGTSCFVQLRNLMAKSLHVLVFMCCFCGLGGDPELPVARR
jgi:hypothetical protein